MSNQLRKLPEKRHPYKRSLYNEFILWTAMPTPEKEELGIETQGQFADYYKVNKDTLTEWKKRDDFEERVDAILKMWSTDKTPAIVQAIYRTAVKGNPLSQMLWLQYFKKFNPKKIEDEEKKVVLGAGDIRHLIEQLPEQLKEKHYGYLRELAEDISAVRNARDTEDHDWGERPTEAIPEETYHDAYDVPNTERSNEMAKGHTTGVRPNMVGNVSASDY